MIKKIFSLVVISFLTINFSYSFQTSKAKKFAKSITEKELKEHLYIMLQMNLKVEILVNQDRKKQLNILETITNLLELNRVIKREIIFKK